MVIDYFKLLRTLLSTITLHSKNQASSAAFLNIRLMFSILHISDLHRSPADAIDSESLVAALAADLDRYMRGTPHVPQPIAIVISGDLIEGAAIGASNWKQSIREQYQVTEDLLDRLCALFLSGNKKHMIVTPGNHDVCWNTAYKAMSRLTKSQYPSDVYASLTQTDSRYRWSWHDQKLYKIMNMSLYEERMNFYWEFVESFYSGVDLQFPLERGRGFQLFDLYERSVLIAAFDSINGNDCYNHAGSIAQASIGNCAMELRNISHDYELKVGLWHHSIQGPPLRSDYMDSSQVQEMIAHGFRLGLHGHQHVAGTLTQHVHLDERKEMAVVGAGSLCAGVGQLPRGQNRQYNLIVIEDEFDRARVHVREMGDGGQFTGKRSGAFLDGYAEVSWSP
ncbi:MAG: metallophosphoesterase, partial [Gammaproteobacteria bacterium]|nr:metallophosphoesterase [Gammaproteobacteria bacterium]